MKCDTCVKEIKDGEAFWQSVGSYDQPLYWCSDTCKDEWYENNKPDPEYDEDYGYF